MRPCPFLPREIAEFDLSRGIWTFLAEFPILPEEIAEYAFFFAEFSHFLERNYKKSREIRNSLFLLGQIAEFACCFAEFNLFIERKICKVEQHIRLKSDLAEFRDFLPKNRGISRNLTFLSRIFLFLSKKIAEFLAEFDIFIAEFPIFDRGKSRNFVF